MSCPNSSRSRAARWSAILHDESRPGSGTIDSTGHVTSVIASETGNHHNDASPLCRTRLRIPTLRARDGVISTFSTCTSA